MKTKHQHFALYKPYGYISQFITNQKIQKKHHKFLGELYHFPPSTMAIGRLDKQSEGLLLLTTNGKISEFIRSNSVEKEYYVQVDGIITPQALVQLQNGVLIGLEGAKYITKPCKAVVLKSNPELPKRAKKIRDERHGATSWVSIIITEGKFRQVRKMTATVGFPTLRLVRYRVGNFTINNMKSGEVKKVLLP